MEQNSAEAGGTIQIAVPIDGAEVTVALTREQAVRLHEVLGQRLLDGQAVPRRRYLDIKPGSLRGS